MKYRRQSLDLHRLLTAEIDLGQLSPALQERILSGLRARVDLHPLVRDAFAELHQRRLLVPSGALREGGDRVILYRLEGSPRLFDLRAFPGVLAGAAPAETSPAPAPSGPDPGSQRPTAEAATDLPAPATVPPPTTPLGASNSHANVNAGAWSTVSAIRATLRRDWVSYGLDSSLDGLLSELRHHLRDPGLELVVWESQLPLAVTSGMGWRLERAGAEAATAASTYDTAPTVPALLASAGVGTTHQGRRWVPVWAGESVVGALGSRSVGDARLLAEAAGAVSDLLQAAQRSQRRVFTDPLTGVHNRGFFDRQLGVEVERGRRANEPLALLFADLDHFKALNDRYGHPAGDRALQHLAGLLAAHVRRIDSVFRYGGEEFALLLPGTDVQEAFHTGERLRRTLRSTPPLIPGVGQLALTISIGGAVFPLHAQEERDLLRYADLAMYQAKSLGRDRVVMYPGSLTTEPPPGAP